MNKTVAVLMGVSVVLLGIACSSNPPPSTTSGSSGAGGVGGHGGLGGSGGKGGAGGEVAPEIDAGPTCSMNGGQTCITAADCPPSAGCDFCFTCDTLPNGEHACRWHPIDAGACDPL